VHAMKTPSDLRGESDSCEAMIGSDAGLAAALEAAERGDRWMTRGEGVGSPSNDRAPSKGSAPFAVTAVDSNTMGVNKRGRGSSVRPLPSAGPSLPDKSRRDVGPLCRSTDEEVG
jgi:hypothetical protein